MKKILFQGDSITDAGRARENDSNTGAGYATLVSAELGYTYPNTYTFFNRGISGNRSIDVLARIKKDIIDIQPDMMSLLIGVNDAWSIDEARFEIYYNMLIEQTMEALPDIKIMILEPFLLKGSGSEADWATVRPQVEKLGAAAQRVAEKHGLTFVPLRQKFDEAAQQVSAEWWTIDGVHPTAAGHELIKREWLKAFRGSMA